MNIPTHNRLINSKELADFLSMSRASIYKIADSDPKFPHYRHGKARRFILDEVLDYMGRNNRNKIMTDRESV